MIIFKTSSIINCGHQRVLCKLYVGLVRGLPSKPPPNFPPREGHSKTQYFLFTWGISSDGRAPDWQSGGQRFDPAILHHPKADDHADCRLFPLRSEPLTSSFLGGILHRCPSVFLPDFVPTTESATSQNCSIFVFQSLL